MDSRQSARDALVQEAQLELHLTSNGPVPASAALDSRLMPSTPDPVAYAMGYRGTTHPAPRNPAATQNTGMRAWQTILSVGACHVHAISLEDWSTEKAPTTLIVAPDQGSGSNRMLRLISPNPHSVLVSATTCGALELAGGASQPLTYAAKALLDVNRAPPVAPRIPCAPGGLLALLQNQGRGGGDA